MMKTRKAQSIVYRIENGQVLCLCLKRSKVDGGFWHVLTGTLEDEETNEECLRREIAEELGNQEVTNISPVLKEWVWNKNGEDIEIIDHAISLKDGEVVLNEEHTQFVWLNPGEARELYEKESAKEMVDLLIDYLTEHYAK